MVHFSKNQQPTLSIKIGSTTQEPSVWDKVSSIVRRTLYVFADDPEISVEVLDAQNQPVEVETIVVDFDYVTATVEIEQTNNLPPGNYTMVVETNLGGTIYVHEQDFSWGVLVFNSHKSVYTPGETAKLSMAVLNEVGRMVCDAEVTLEITRPNGEVDELTTNNNSIWVNPDCEIKDFTENPDYESVYDVHETGTYEVLLSAETKNGPTQMKDYFEVHESVPFDVERQTATRIYPAVQYPVRLHITANQDFEGIITERVPISFIVHPLENRGTFTISPVNKDELEIRWRVDIKNGETIQLGYTYDAPNKSPERFLLGPLQFYTEETEEDDSLVFSEVRKWQIAVDAVGDFGSIWYLRSTTASDAFGTTGPTAEYSSVNETQAGPSDRTTALAMTVEIGGPTHTTVTATETSATNPTYQWLRTFVSPKLAAQTLNSGSTFRLEFGLAEDNINNNAFAQVHVYQWREGTGHIATLFDGADSDIDCGLEPDRSANLPSNMVCVTSGTSSSASIQDGDQIAVEFWVRSENTSTQVRTTSLYYNGNTFIGRGVLNDSYEPTSAMSTFAVSQALLLQTQVNKGSNWFLRPTTASTAYNTTGPTSKRSSVTDAVSGSPTNKTTALAMTDEIGASLQSVAGSETSNVNPTYMWVRTFLTPELAAQTIAAGTTFRIEAAIAEAATSNNAFLQTTIFRWRQSDSSSEIIIDNAASDIDCGLEPDGSVNNARNQTCVTAATSSDITLQAGDQLGVEYWIRFENTTTNANIGFTFNGTTFIERGVANDSYTNNDGISMFSSSQTLLYPSASSTITVSGTAYEADGTTVWSGCDNSTARISVVVNGGTAASTSCNSSTGAYQVNDVPVSANQSVSAFYNTTGSNTEKGVAVTVAANGDDNISLNITQDVVQLSTEAGVSTIANSNLTHCHSGSPAQCSNVPYVVSGSVVTIESGVTALVTNGTSYTPGGNLITQGSGGLHLDDSSSFIGSSSESHTIAGNITIDSGATLTAPTSGTLTVGGSWSNAGTFTAGSGQVVFNAATTGNTLTSGGSAFHNLNFNNASGSWTLQDNLTVNNVLTITAGTLNGSSRTISLTGSGTPFVLNGTFNADSSTVSYEGTSDTTIAATNYFNLQTNPASGTPLYTIEGGGQGDTWFDSNWSNRKLFTIDESHIDEALTDFPVLVSITDSDLQVNAQTDGDDIIFTAADGTTQLDHEIEKYVTGSGELVAWIKLPAVSSTESTQFYMYYGNSAAENSQNAPGVWSNGYIGVWHLKENASGTGTTNLYKNSVSNTYHANDNVASTDKTGRLGDGQFMAEGDYLELGNITEIVSIPEITINAWLRRYELNNKMSVGRQHYDQDIMLELYDDFVYFGASSGSWAGGTVDNNDLNWHYISYVFDGNLSGNSQRLKGYIDGTFQSLTFDGTVGTQTTSNTTPVRLNWIEVWDEWGSGWYDEIRIATVARSAGWLNAEYANQNSPSTFYSVSAQQSHTTTVGWYNTSWSYRKKITIDNTQVSGSSNLTDFPILVSLSSDDNLAANAQADGDDILFTSDDGTTKLSHEIEKYQSDTGELVAWVKIPSLAHNEDTEIYVYYGNSEASDQQNVTDVWSNGYEAVYNLHQNTNDSTTHARNGANTGTTAATGKIAEGREYSSSTDEISTGTWSISGNQLTVQSWIKLDSIATSVPFITKADGNNGNQGVVYSLGTGSSIGSKLAGGVKTGTSDDSGTSFIIGNTTINTGQWYMAHITYNGSALNLYLNGSSDASSVPVSGNMRENSYIVALGNVPTNFMIAMDGILDSGRISSVARSSDWIATEYNNQNNPTSFYSVGSQESGPAAWYNYDWSNRKKITIDHTKVAGSTNLTNFPVLINLSSDTNLASLAQSDGDDILFTNSDGTTKLSHEIEKYTTSTGELVAWVKIPTLTYDQDTDLYMYFGNTAAENQQDAQNVWSTDMYLTVQHLQESPANSTAGHLDSTANGLNGTPLNFAGTSGSTTNGTGKIDGADEFDGSDDYIDLGSSTAFHTGTGNFSFSAWVKTSQNCSGNKVYTGKRQSNISVWLGCADSGGNGKAFFSVRDSNNVSINTGNGTTTINNDGWHYLVGVKDGNTSRIYVNGAQENSASGTFTGNFDGGTVQIGRFNASPFYNASGIIDEVRYAKTAFSPDWIQTEYNNQNNPASFYSLSAAESGNNSELTITNNFTLTGSGSGTVDVNTQNILVPVGGNFTIGSGQTFNAASTAPLTVQGNFSNSGTFTHNSGTVYWLGANQTYSGTTTFYNLFVTGTTARTVTFTGGSTVAVANNGSLTFTGAAGQLLSLQSSNTSAWNLQVSNTGTTVSVSYVSASRSNAGGYKQIDASNGTNIDGNNNTNWYFGEGGGDETPTLNKLMRHGGWFDLAGIRRLFTF